MINRTPMTGMQARSNQQGGRAGVHYGRNPHAGAGAQRPGGGSEAAQAQSAAVPRSAVQQAASERAPQREPTYDGAADNAAQQSAQIPYVDQQPHGMAQAVSVSDAPEALKNPLFLPGYLRTLIGRTIRAEFLIFKDFMEERTGMLTDVGANYIVLQDPHTRNCVLCDSHSLKFITVVEDEY